MGVPLFYKVTKGGDEKQVKCALKDGSSLSVTVLSSCTSSSTYEENLTEKDKNENRVLYSVIIISLFVLALGLGCFAWQFYSNSMMQTEETHHQNVSSTHVELPQISHFEIEKQQDNDLDTLPTCEITPTDTFLPMIISTCKWRLDGSEEQGWAVSFEKVSKFLSTSMMEVVFLYGDDRRIEFHFVTRAQGTSLSVPKDLKVWMILPPRWNNMRIVLKRPKKNRVVQTCSVGRKVCDEEKDDWNKQTFKSCEVFDFNTEKSDSCITKLTISEEGWYRIDLGENTHIFEFATELTPLWHEGVIYEETNRFNISHPFIRVGYNTPKTFQFTTTSNKESSVSVVKLYKFWDM